MTAKAGLLAQTAFSRAHRRLCGMLALEDYRAMGPAFDGRVQVAANLEASLNYPQTFPRVHLLSVLDRLRLHPVPYQ